MVFARCSVAFLPDLASCSANVHLHPVHLSSVFIDRLKPLLSVPAQFGAARYDGGNFKLAAQMFAELATAPELADFLTLPAYDVIVQKDTVQAQSRM